MTSPEYDNAVNNSLPGTPVDPEERQRQEEEWKAELAKVRQNYNQTRLILAPLVGKFRLVGNYLLDTLH